VGAVASTGLPHPWSPTVRGAEGSAHHGEANQRADLTFASAAFSPDGENRAFMSQFLSVANLGHS